MAMDRQEFATMVRAWVIGRLYEICMPGGHYFSQMAAGNNSFDHVKFHNFALSIHNTVYAYMMHRKTLDGTCSDMECGLAMEASRIFRVQLNQVLYDDIIFARDSGDFAEAVAMYQRMELCGQQKAEEFVMGLKSM